MKMFAIAEAHRSRWMHRGQEPVSPTSNWFLGGSRITLMGVPKEMFHAAVRPSPATTGLGGTTSIEAAHPTARSSGRPPTTPAPRTSGFVPMEQPQVSSRHCPHPTAGFCASVLNPTPWLSAIAGYARNFTVAERGWALRHRAAYCLMDTLACGFQALESIRACRQTPGSGGAGER